MPLLSAETNVYPADLFVHDADGLDLESRWSVLYTRPRQEKALARQLLQLHIPFYVPIIARRLRLQYRKMTAHVPLFPGYVFLLATRDQRVMALTTNRIVQTLTVTDQTSLWRDLRQVYRLLASGAPVAPEDRLAPGDKVEIKTGALAGLKGKILRTATGRRFVVEVDFIQRGASILLDDDCLTPTWG
jgi:transcriptional antiterminator RfaH